MKTFKRICIKDINIEDCQLKKGEEYITTDIKNKNVIVFTSPSWLRVPASTFNNGEVFTL